MAKRQKIAACAAAFAVVTIAVCLLYLTDNYKADLEAVAALGYEGITVKDDGDTMVFTPKGTAEAGFIFYPGGKVEHRAYAGLMMALSDRGIMCIVPKMPFDLAVFDVNAADGLTDSYPKVERWYIGGHSLGGSMAASYLGDNAGDFDGLVLLGSYSTENLRETSLEVLTVYGSEDKVLNGEKYAQYRENLPENTVEYVIDGGNHAYFGTYGEQDGDGEAKITNKQQIEITADKIIELIK